MGAAIYWNGITNGHLKESKDITTYYNQKKMNKHYSPYSTVYLLHLYYISIIHTNRN